MKELREIKSRYDFSLDNRQVVLIVSGLILVLMLSFLMGTLFGRNLARMAGESEMVSVAQPAPVEALEVKNLPASEEAREPGPSVEKEGVAGAEAAEVETSSREDFIRQLESMKVPTELKPEKEEELTAPAPPVMGKLDPEEDDFGFPGDEDEEPAETEEKAGGRDSDAEAPAEKPSEAAPRLAIPAGAYTIQLASLPGKDDAEAMLKELKEKRYDAYMLQVTLPEKGTFYRVRVGHYKDLDQARKALRILQSREGKYFDAWITQ